MGTFKVLKIERLSADSDLSNVSTRMNKYTNKTNYYKNLNLTPLNGVYANMIKKRKYVKRFLNDDKLLRTLFMCLDQELDHRMNEKVFHIREFDIFSLQRNMYKVEDIDYCKCAYCDNVVEINYKDKIKYDNFLCSECKGSYVVGNVVDESVVNTFKSFIERVNEKLNKKYEILFKLIKFNQDPKIKKKRSKK